MGRALAELTVDRIINELRQFTLLKRELEWYRREEPVVYQKIRESLILVIQTAKP